MEDLTPEEVKERSVSVSKTLLLRDSNSQKTFAGRRASKKKNCQKKEAEKEERKSLEDEAEGVVVGTPKGQ